MKIKSALATFLMLALCGTAEAGTKALGFELGVSTFEQVRTSMQNKGEVDDAGVNKYSKGRMLKADGTTTGIAGTDSVLYIFDSHDTLSGIVMTMSKNRFDDVFEALKSKYKPIKIVRPFVGNSYASFKTTDAIIEINSPHMSFELEVRYIKDELMQTFKKTSTEEAAETKKRETAQF